MSFQVDNEDKSSQAVIAIDLDDIRIAEYLDLVSAPGFRNVYPEMSTIVENVGSGSHTIKVSVPKTGDEGILTYTTNFVPYTSYLVIENPKWVQGDTNGDGKIGLEEAIGA